MTAVTVCVPTIGRTETLVATLDSLRRQEFGDYEVLVLDNAAPADAQSAIADYAASDQRVNVLRAPQRLDMFHNFQRGVDAARGRYLAFFHDDDLYAADFLTQHVQLLDAHPKAAFSGSNCTVIDEAGAIIADRGLIAETTTWDGWRYIRAVFELGMNVFPMQSIVFRRDALPAGVFSSTEGIHYTDFLLLMRMAEKHAVGLLSSRTMQLRSHPEQASRRLGVDQSLQLRTKLFAAYCDELAERWPGRRSEVAALRRAVRRAQRRAALWSWLSAPDPDRARESRVALGRRGVDRWLGYGLLAADRSGLARALVRRPAVQRRLRSAAYSIASRGTH